MFIKTRKHAAQGLSPAMSSLGVASVAAAVGLAVASHASAGEPSDVAGDGATTLETVHIVGTAEQFQASSKFTQSLQDTPQTIQVIGKELLHQQGATTLTEALRNSPAVGTFYAGENGSTSTGDSVYMRGFDSSGSIFADGIRDLGAISRDLFNVEAVEVQKGPAGTDNGRTAPTGAINTVSKQAFLEDALAASASGGVDGQKRITADWNQTLGLTGSALRLNTLWQDSDVVGREHVRNQRWGVAPTIGFGLDAATRLHASFYYVQQDNVPDGFVPTIGLPRWTPQPGLEQLVGHPVDPESFYGTRDDHDNVTVQMYTLRLEHDLAGAASLTNTARWGRTDQDYLLSAYRVTGGTDLNPMAGDVKWTDANDLATYTLARGITTIRDQRNDILTDQLNLRVDFITGAVEHNMSTGVELTREDYTVWNNAATGSRPDASLYDPDWNDVGDLAWARNGTRSDGRTDTLALYLFDTLKFGSRFLVTGGLRADRYQTGYDSTGICNDGTGRGAVSCGGAPIGTIVSTADLTDRATLFNWKLGAVYKPVRSLSLYLNYALSQQPPGGANFQLSTSAGNASNPNLDPQEARTIELGSKWNALDERLMVNFALFQTAVSNEINTQIVDDQGNPTQTGRKRVRGIELSVVGKLTRNWSVSAGVGNLDTKVTEGAAVTQDGTPNLTYTPGYSITTWTSYRLPFGLTVGGGLRFMDGLHRGTDGAAGTPGSTGGYGVLDAVASYELNQSLSLRMNAYNVTDRHYVASINKSGYRYLPGAPRSFLLSADWRF
jgi:catecholate siderophore receptor